MEMDSDKIKFLPGLETECDLSGLDDSKLVRLVQFVNSKQLILQVTRIAEDWFALNSLALCVYKHLQSKGCLTTVTVHKVDAANLPASFVRSIEGRREVESISARLRRRDTVTCPLLRNPESLLEVKLEVGEGSEDEEEGWECSVCGDVYSGLQALERHQEAYLHWGCGFCEERFDDLYSLNTHKERMDHWTDDEESDDEDSDDERMTTRVGRESDAESLSERDLLI